ncbi:GNAT family N-acetyltransferase [Ureibacillus manganicus]|nr:GNAT family N-acetyltransferase [Ureibacillus manganicus]
MFTIDCGDILLREFQVEDVDAIYEITNQPEVYEFLPDWKSTREQRFNWVTNYEIPSNKSFLEAVPNIEEQRYLRLGIVLKETGEFIGFCTTGIKEELPAPNREIAFGISKYHTNKGYTSLAVKGLIQFLFANTNVECLNAVALERNVGSNRVIQKNGFEFVGQIEIDKELHNHYVLQKSEWQGR